ncbi:MAG TPA: alpha-2-macroglobulin family protein [Acetobacteraceae bacterium]|nr:alpha-2-macroglobulin family protein [Acetobacteraceae bacterium]
MPTHGGFQVIGVAMRLCWWAKLPLPQGDGENVTGWPGFSRWERRFFIAITTLLVLLLLPCLARADNASPPLDQVQRADGVLVVPDHFLRRWDPLTVFFPADTGPAQTGPEDHPERVVTLSPTQPGAWRWLGPRVLQFRPTEPWTPLRRVTIAAGNRATTLVPLLPEPVQTAPQDQPEGLANLDTISLTFQDPVDPAALARLLTIELRPLPGVDAAGGQTLTREDFDLRPLERAGRADKQTYLVMLHQRLPDQRLVIIRLRLSDEPGLDDPIFELRLSTATPFTLSDLDCGDGYSSRTTDGLTLCTPSSNPDDSGAGVRRRSIVLKFSAAPQPLDILQARNALRIAPPVDDLHVAPGGADDGQTLRINGSFAAETEYTLRVAPGSLTDRRGRTLTGAAHALRFAFHPVPPRLVWDTSQGIAEQLGPQMVPVRGHGYDHADVRIHRIDPLDRDFWPFPPAGLDTADAAAPPLSGNEPGTWTDPGSIRARDIAARIKALGSPSVSELLALPQAAGGADAKFGLDLQPLLARIAGPRQAGTYLVGLLPLQGNERHWIRLQVTDLSLTAVEEPGRVRFAVTWLATARPVPGAQIRIEGLADKEYRVLAEGSTDADGAFTYTPREGGQAAPQRIVVQKATDTLVLQTAPGPQQYANGNWTQPRGSWLAWPFTKTAISARAEKPRILCHVFTERPIYRPEEAVEIRGFVRRYLHGTLADIDGTGAGGKGTLLVQGPDKQEWRYPVTLDDTSGFYLHFDAKTEATGDYTVSFRPEKEADCDSAGFKKEAYRLPTFEVLLNNPPRVPLDAPFQVGLLARYYAGGVVTDRPIKWRVTQFPYTWSPPGREGFLFSSDARFSGEQAFRSTPVMESDGKTDAGGAAQLTLDPTLEPTAQPRTYVVEATVTGDDGQQIRNVAHVPALPPFVLGVKMPRYLAQPGAIAADLLALDAEGKPRAGLDMTVRLIKRDWNSVLQASDFTQGTAKYVTQEIDRTLEERRVTSTDVAQTLNFNTTEAGIYVVEVTASDRLGRRQTLRVDCFMAGDTPVTWSRPPAKTVTLNTDKDDYAPGENATLLIESPFQAARALVVTEQPGGTFDYAWVDVANGVGRYTLAVRKDQMPRMPVHVLLMRGRLAGPSPSATAPFDQGKPTTLAATVWIKVRQVQNRVTVAFEAPAAARPAQTVEVALRLSDEGGKPLAGEATFWMVDQAVLALAKEAPLDPLPKFIVERPSRMVARDTRNMAFGIIPLQENPGGGEGNENPGIENISVRRNFTPVPIYLPHVKVGPDGVAHIQVKLPDTLTVFMLRAEVTSGPDRFGFATGQMRVRQPIVAQPVLPRFLRPGDTFDAEVLGRVVEGPGGAGTAVLSVDGLTATGGTEEKFVWNGGAPAKASFPVSVPQPAPGHGSATIRFLVRRDSDQVGDGVEIALPIHPDRPPVHERRLVEVAPGASADLPAPPGEVRAGSYAGSLAIATDPALARSLGALDYLLTYPFGCTEQRIALASAELALLPFAPIAGAERLQQRVGVDAAAALRAIAQAVDENGLVGFWPHTRGLVTLTAWSYELMIRVQAAHLPVDAALRDRLAVVLNQSLRSDFPHLLTDSALLERATALYALAAGGKLDAAYASELARTAGALNTSGLAMVVSAIAATPNADRALVAGLLETLWSRVHVLARNGAPAYAGLADYDADPLVLPSETRGLAEVTRAVALATPEEPRLALLRGGLVDLGGPDGWGSTNADAAALRALAASWDVPALGGSGADVPVTVALPDGSQQATLSHAVPMARWTSAQPGPMRVANGGARPVLALQQAAYVPTAPGWQATSVQHGFVLTRALLRVPGGSAPMVALAPGPDGTLHLASGDVVEETAELVNPEAHTMVAVALPIAAGLEPLNPNLATAPAEAAPSAGPTLAPTYTAFGDDSVLYVYESLPAGTYQFRFRARAGTVGSFTEPPATAEMMYRQGVDGASAGSRLVIAP